MQVGREESFKRRPAVGRLEQKDLGFYHRRSAH